MTIQLSLPRSMRLAGPGLITATACLLLASQIAWPWRLTLVATVLVLGLVSWRRYLRRRPVSLTSGPGGALRGERADGSTFEVVRLLPGVIRPWLVTARLVGRAGGSIDLFVPGRALAEPEHWRLRRALVGFRPGAVDQPEERRGM